MFPGCVIPYRLPFIEVSIRKVLDYLGIDFKENSSFSCCPDPNGIKNSNKLLFSITAARNLALAEKEGQAILTPCNGCFTSLKKVKGEIEEDHHFMRKLNQYLDKIELQVQGSSQVFHMVEFFSKFKRDVIRENLKYPLTGLKVALHYGCHFLRPSNKVQLDDPLEPTIFDNLIEDLGAESVDYDLKMECCGGSLERAGKPDLSLEIIHAKLGSIQEKEADCIVVCCPQCYIQFDHLQQTLNKLDYKFKIPVLYYSELLCLALGIDIQETMRKHHRTKIEPLFEKIKIIQEKNEKIREHFDLNFLLRCYSCGACDNDCIIAKMTDFSPNKIIGNLLKGDIDDVIEDPSIWMCLDCYLCYELCPMRVGLIEIFTILRNLAAEKGFTTKGYETEFSSFYQKGIIGMLSKAARKTVGLDFIKPDIGDLKKLFNIVEREGVKRDS
ncbi:MAG: heterodisulfide reductase-related iron-sulfur binding cluster [Promethearchaeota archaeon]